MKTGGARGGGYGAGAAGGEGRGGCGVGGAGGAHDGGFGAILASAVNLRPLQI